MKKKLLYFFVFLIIIFLVILIACFYNKDDNKKDNIKSNCEFLINKIHYYSTANAVSNTTNYQNPEWNLRVYQYTDIAIYLDRLNSFVKEENYITNLEISNIKVNLPEKEEVYYLNPKLFGKSTLDLDMKIEDKLEYSVINDNNSDNEQNYNIPIYFQDCSNPITLRYINFLDNNFKVSKENSLVYNGSLIRELGLDLKKLDSNLSFDLVVTTKDGKKRLRNIKLEIPFENNGDSILDGDFNIEKNYNIEF